VRLYLARGTMCNWCQTSVSWEQEPESLAGVVSSSAGAGFAGFKLCAEESTPPASLRAKPRLLAFEILSSHLLYYFFFSGGG